MASSNNKVPASKFMPSGYDYEFVLDVPEEYICKICESPMWKPVQTKCGHRFCKDCLDEANKRKKPAECPMDRQQLRLKQDIFDDKAAERLILSFVIKCPSEGCQWQGELGDLKDHTCTPVSVALTVSCSNKCGKKIKKEEIAHHLSKECAMTVVPCVYHRLGCSTKTRRKSMDKHMENSILLHFNITCDCLMSLEDENCKLKFSQNKVKQQCTAMCEELAKEVTDLNKDFKQLKSVEADLKTVVKEKGELSKEFRTLKSEIKQQAKDLNTLGDNLDTSKKDKRELAMELKMLKDEMEKQVNKYKTDCKTEKQEKEKARKEKEELSKQVKDLTKKLEIGQEERKELFEQVKDLPKKIESNAVKRKFIDVFFDIIKAVLLVGLFVNFSPQIENALRKIFQPKCGLSDNRLTNNYILKIKNFDGMFREAQTRNEDIFHREIFYSEYGYRLQVTVYPNGYGKGKNTHLSLFVAILRGEYDSIIPWPFTQTIKITLVDQKDNVNKRKNIEKMIVPKGILNTPEGFKRPKDEALSTYGFPKFVSLKQLRKENYVFYGLLFVKIEIGSP